MTTRIVMLPGLGADGRLFGPQLEHFESATVPGWIPPVPGEALGSYAARFAESAIQPAAGEDWIAVGFSFGGMVALEIASMLPVETRPRAVAILSGLRSRRSVTRGFRLQTAIGTVFPRFLAEPMISGPLTALFAKMCGLEKRWSEELFSMSAELDWGFMRWAARAAAAWDFEGECPVPVCWMHGERDRIVPYVPHPAFSDDVCLLDDSSHLLTWTRADVVNAWIEEMAQGT